MRKVLTLLATLAALALVAVAGFAIYTFGWRSHDDERQERIRAEMNGRAVSNLAFDRAPVKVIRRETRSIWLVDIGGGCYWIDNERFSVASEPYRGISFTVCP